MCGIAGYWGRSSPDAAVAERMASRLAHRGPDDAGVWLDEATGIALAHRRLSIIDLSTAGRQPMRSPCGRFVMVYNGEIYNHLELRAELDAGGDGYPWRGHSDTETLLAAVSRWGTRGALERFNGMFAFALWDAEQRSLTLARDRMGEKPLYYGHLGDTLVFASELKALAVHPSWRGDVDRDALTLFLRHNYIPAPHSIYQGIAKLPPGHCLTLRNPGDDVAPECYWDLAEVAAQGAAGGGGDAGPMADELDALLRDSVRRRMMADVPLGAFLSGGIDSSTVAALMQAESSRPIRTFSIGFTESRFDEAPHARAVADHLGTDHTELYVSPEDALAVIPRLPKIYDEPFSDSSQIPTVLICELARRHVTVSLSGDGGDELFYGYGRYRTGARAWGVLSRTPGVLRRLSARALAGTPTRALQRVAGRLPGGAAAARFVDRLPKLAPLVLSESGEALYRELVSHEKAPEQLVPGATEPDTPLSATEMLPELPGLQERMMYLDMLTYLPGDILAKVDRASMAASLEVRVPLLDHRLVEMAWRVPTAFKYRAGEGKWLLRQVLHRYVPRHLLDRPKMGFGVPMEQWLRGPLADWTEDLLNPLRMRDEGYLDPRPIQVMWHEHRSGRRRWHYYLWDLLMFQAWLRDQQLAG